MVEEWKDCEEHRPKPKENWVFVEKKSETDAEEEVKT